MDFFPVLVVIALVVSTIFSAQKNQQKKTSRQRSSGQKPLEKPKAKRSLRQQMAEIMEEAKQEPAEELAPETRQGERQQPEPMHRHPVFEAANPQRMEHALREMPMQGEAKVQGCEEFKDIRVVEMEKLASTEKGLTELQRAIILTEVLGRPKAFQNCHRVVK